MSFSIHFIICNLVLSALLGILLFFKKILRKHISPDSQYRIWYVFAAALLLPFLPYAPSGPGRMLDQFLDLLSAGTAAPAGAPAAQNTADASFVQLGMTDLASSFAGRGFRTAGILLTAIWAAGCCISAALVLRHILKIRRIKKTGLSDHARDRAGLIQPVPVLHKRTEDPQEGCPVRLLQHLQSCILRPPAAKDHHPTGHGRPAGRGGYTLYLSP